MKITKLFQRTVFGIIALFGLIGISTSVLSINAVDNHLSNEYVSNSKAIANTIADAGVDIILNRDLSSLQSLIDQFVEIQGISYIYITNEHGEFLAHTFVPGIPQTVLDSDVTQTETVQRTIEGAGDFVEVGSPILAGMVGAVHIGMDIELVTQKIQAAIGQQVYLIAIVFLVGIVAAIWFVNFASKPIDMLQSYAVELATKSEPDTINNQKLLERKDEAGELARLFQYFAAIVDPNRIGPPPEEPDK